MLTIFSYKTSRRPFFSDCRFQLLFLKHILVDTAKLHQFLVVPALLCLPVLQNKNLIRILYCRNTVRNQNRRFPLSVCFQIMQNFFLRIRVNGGKRIIQNEYRGILFQRPCNGASLLLTA